MKNLIFILFFFLTLNVNAQDRERQSLYKSKNGWEIIRVVKNQIDTSTFFYWSFRNAKYTHITDLGSVFLPSKDELEAFANKLKEFSSKVGKVTVSSTLGKVTLSLYDFSNDIYIETSDGKYFIYSKKNSLKVADEILLNSHLLN